MATNLCLEVVDNSTFKVNEIEVAGATDLVTLWGTNNVIPAGPSPSTTTGEFEVLSTTFTATGTAGQYSTDSAIQEYEEPAAEIVSITPSLPATSYGPFTIEMNRVVSFSEVQSNLKVVNIDNDAVFEVNGTENNWGLYDNGSEAYIGAINNNEIVLTDGTDGHGPKIKSVTWD